MEGMRQNLSRELKMHVHRTKIKIFFCALRKSKKRSSSGSRIACLGELGRRPKGTGTGIS